MKVIVDSNFIIKDLFEPPLELHLEGNGLTLEALLKKVKDMCAPATSLELLQEGEIGDDISYVFLNGKNCFSLPAGLRTLLEEGDRVEVEIYMEPMEGG
jgi:hypothetical protein